MRAVPLSSMSTAMHDAAAFRQELSQLVRAHFPLIQVDTQEEDRALSEVRAVAADVGKRLVLWSTSRGVFSLDGEAAAKAEKGYLKDLAGAVESFESMARKRDHAANGYIFVLLDPHPYLTDPHANPIYRRRLREFAMDIRTDGLAASCIILAPGLAVPDELDKEVSVLDFPLPSRDELRREVERFLDRVRQNGHVSVETDASFSEALVDAAAGLTMTEVQNALAHAVIGDLRLDRSDVARIFAQKRQIVRKSEILDFVETDGLSAEQIGGLDRLKDWLRQREPAFTPEGRAFGIQAPRGVLVTGVPGCGKSWSAKCMGASWGLPVVKLDMGKVYASLVGSSEERMRRAIQVAEAVAPCVMWIDEIEKGLPRPGQHVGDNGVSLRVLGTFLTWLQEKASNVFVFATANQLHLLPPEVVRKGRFDEIFFVDLPDGAERRRILDIHLRRAGREPERFALDRLAELTGEDALGEGIRLTGAELAAAVNEGLIHAFNRGKANGGAAELETADMEAVLDATLPLARLRSDEIAHLRGWARGHAVPAAHEAP